MEHIRMMELERYFAGELGGADAERVGLHVGSCAECGAMLAELEAGRARFLNAHPFEEFARCTGVVKNVGYRHINIDEINISDNVQSVNKINISDTVRKVNKINIFDSIRKVNKINILNAIRNVNKEIFIDRTGVPKFYGAVFATAVLLMFLPVALTTYWHKSSTDDNNIESQAVGGGGIRYKGIDRLSFMLMRDGEVRLGSPTETYRVGDRLQVVYSHPKSHHAALFSVDNAGTVSFYTGNNNDLICSITADSGSDLTFPSSIILDDSRGEELVVMLISKSPVSVKDVGDIVKSLSSGKYDNLSRIEDGLRRGKLGIDMTVSSVRIKKE